MITFGRRKIAVLALLVINVEIVSEVDTVDLAINRLPATFGIL